MKIKELLLLALCAFSIALKAQYELSIPYRCSFEDPVENSKWVIESLKPGSTEKTFDKWMIGDLDFYEGQNSLYISADTGKTVSYGAKPNVVVAYRSFVFQTTGKLDVSFYWKGMGEAGKSGLYVCVLRSTDDSVSVANSGILPKWVDRRAQVFATGKMLYGSPSWKAESFQLDAVAGRECKLAFVWQNTNTDTVFANASCIDDIQIASTNCPKPTNLQCQSACDTMFVSWKGVSAKYEIDYRHRGTTKWIKNEKVPLGGAETVTHHIDGISEGAYDIRVRGICGVDTSAYISLNNVVSFCPDNHCINYVNLDSAVCETGVAVVDEEYPFFPCPPVDKGSNSINSRHTVNWAQGYDPRTENQLKLIPDGEIASVRLGNWNTGNGAERISYKYIVDSAVAPILLLKYAVVMQTPNHDDSHLPRFDLEILKEDGTLVDATCGKAEFVANVNLLDGWNKVGDKLVWKDWTTVGLNLAPYHGQTLTIRLRTQDCTDGGHYGYAYFTLGCASGQITGDGCGDDPEITLSAPDGFVYDWYNPDSPQFTSDKQSITVPANDTTTYYCKVSFVEQAECSFILSTKVFPRYPVPDFDWTIEHKNCSTTLRLHNKSVVKSRFNGVETVLQNEKCQTYYWDIDNSALLTSLTDPVYKVPDKGGRIPVTLIAGIADDNCQEDTTIYIDVPAICEHHDTLYEDMCFEEGGRVLGTQFISESGTYYDSCKNVFGCDSVTVLYLNVWPQVKDSVMYDTICFGAEYLWNGKRYTTAGKHEYLTKNGHGCDSVAVLNLYVRPEVLFTVDKVDVEDIPHSGEITIKPDASLGDDYTYSINGVMGGALTGLDGGEYKIVVYNRWNCPSDTMTVFLDADCLEATVGTADYVCASDRAVVVPVTVTEGVASTYSVRFDSAAVKAGFTDMDETPLSADGNAEIPLPQLCRPGTYKVSLVLHDIICDDIEFPVDISVYYDSTIIAQKWNDVLAVYNAENNGGYTFTEYQWYRNGVAIPGANAPYYYLEGAELSVQDYYHVELRREDDGVSIPSCSVTPTVHTDRSEYITVVQPSAVGSRVIFNVPSDNVTVDVYTSVGTFVSRYHLDSGRKELQLPLPPGVYLLNIYGDDIQTVEKITVH